jgi:hypothetical protein
MRPIAVAELIYDLSGQAMNAYVSHRKTAETGLVIIHVPLLNVKRNDGPYITRLD